jgi:hypothetical protein
VTLTLGRGDWTVRAAASLGGILFGSGGTSFRITGSSAQYVTIIMSSFYLTDIDAVNAALDSSSPGSLSDPVPLEVSLDLAGGGWAALLSAIDTAGKYVALDLSACTMSGTEFDPQPGPGDAGESRIVSLVLPGTATSIAAGADTSNPAFKHFAALTELNAAAVETVGGYAFWGCTSLGSVSLPRAVTIADAAFSGCSSLSSISLPRAVTIADAAFASCTGLGSVSLPGAVTIADFAFASCTGLGSVSLPRAVTIADSAFASCSGLVSVSLPATGIGNSAFESCTSLASVSLPKAETIGNAAFASCSALTVTLGDTPPELGNGLFHNVTGPQSVTVKVPNNAAWSGLISGSPYGETTTPFTENWGNGFRGGGWGGTAMISIGEVNANITLDIQAVLP